MARGKNHGQRYDHIYRKLNELINNEFRYTEEELVAKYIELKGKALSVQPRSNWEIRDQENLVSIINFSLE